MANYWVFEYEQDRVDTTSRVVGDLADYFSDYVKQRKSVPSKMI
jgi:hypothetical protein